jgi:hypothetical protein
MKTPILSRARKTFFALVSRIAKADFLGGPRPKPTAEESAAAAVVAAEQSAGSSPPAVRNAPTTPAAVGLPLSATSPTAALAGICAVLAISPASGGSLPAFRTAVRARIAARVTARLAELGFAGVVGGSTAPAPVPAESQVEDSPEARCRVLAAELGLAESALSASPEAARAVVTSAIENRVMCRVAALGFPSGDLPSSFSAGDQSGEELEDIQTQLRTERDPARAGILAARANKLRDAKWRQAVGSN